MERWKKSNLVLIDGYADATIAIDKTDIFNVNGLGMIVLRDSGVSGMRFSNDSGLGWELGALFRGTTAGYHGRESVAGKTCFDGHKYN